MRFSHFFWRRCPQPRRTSSATRRKFPAERSRRSTISRRGTTGFGPHSTGSSGDPKNSRRQQELPTAGFRRDGIRSSAVSKNPRPIPTTSERISWITGGISAARNTSSSTSTIRKRTHSFSASSSRRPTRGTGTRRRPSKSRREAIRSFSPLRISRKTCTS